MEAKLTGISLEMLIHPGEILSDILAARKITQKELAIRTGTTPKHISGIVAGRNRISPALAKKFEYALNLEASYWLNLQTEYDKDLLEYEELNGISEAEKRITKNLKPFVDYIVSKKFIPDANADVTSIYLRKLFNVSNLTVIPKTLSNGFAGAFRVSEGSIDLYMLFAWIQLCKKTLTFNIVEKDLDLELLQNSLPLIKSLMFSENMQTDLTRVFADCGISFCIVKNFKGAPVQGLITQNKKVVSLCMTIRYSFVDIFWFTLFHEIHHVLNGDYKKSFIDFESVDDKAERDANKFAGDYLLNPDDYSRFINEGDYSLAAINRFATQQKVLDCIVIGRLQKEKRIPYNKFASQKRRYKWIDE